MNILSFLHQGISAILPFILLLGVLIFVHELGHFLVARWCGVRVEVFSLGFGKKILKYKKGDTTYAISIIPLGGYVKMFGEQSGDTVSAEEKKFSFSHKNVWQRIAIVIAGPLMNFLFAIFLFFIVAVIGEEFKSPIVGDVDSQSIAFKAGFRSGDKVISVNGDSVKTWDDIQKRLNLRENLDLHVDFIVERQNSHEMINVAVEAKAKPNPNVLSKFDYVGEIEGFSGLSLGTTVGVKAGYPLDAVGLKTGDTIKSINGQKVQFWRDLDTTLASIDPKSALSLEVLGTRDGDSKESPITITLAPLESINLYTLEKLGIESSEFYFGKIVDKSPAQNAGLKPLDRILRINHLPIQKWEDVISIIKKYDGRNPIEVTVVREGNEIDLKMTPQLTTQMTPGGSEEKRYTIGISPIVNYATGDLVVVKADGLISALNRGVERTWDMSLMTVLSFVKLFQAKISPKNIGGVISIGQAASETFKLGMTQFLQMMAVISVNLFVLNLLPVPVLDGGHLVFYIIEVLNGAPLSLRKMEIAQQVGLAILMSLMVFALFNDFTRLLGL